MKIAILMATSLLCSVVTHAQTLAQPSVSNDCGGSNSCSASLANPVTVGNTLLAVVRMGTTNAAAAKVSDTLGNTYTLDASVAQTVDGHSLAVYRAQVPASGTATVTITNTSASTMRILGYSEVMGLVSGPPDGTNKAIGSNNTPTGGAVLPTQPNDYILLAASTADAEAFTAGGGFHCEQYLSKGAFADQYLATATSVSGSMTLSSADQWAAITIAYKAMARLPVSFQLNYSDGTTVQGSVQLASVAGTTTTPMASWPINSAGSVTAYLPLVNTGTYSYTVFDLSGKQLQTISVLPGAFAALGGLHSIQGTVTLNKSTDALMIPASLSLQ